MSLIVGLGACVLDTLIEVDKYPDEDTKQKSQRVLRCGGGPVGNALAAVSVLGEQAVYIGTMPKNSDGDFLTDELESYGVKSFASRVAAEAFRGYVILNKEKGSRTCIFNRGTLPDDPSLLNMEVLKKQRFCIWTGIF